MGRISKSQLKLSMKKGRQTENLRGNPGYWNDAEAMVSFDDSS